MEVYNFYQTFATILSMYKLEINVILFGAVIFAFVPILVFFVLQGFGLYKMAKNCGLKKKALAFIPFANTYYAGKLAGECNFFGQKMKRVGLYAMLAQVFSSLLAYATIAAEIYLYSVHGAPETMTQVGIPCWIGLEGFSVSVYSFYDVSSYILPIFSLVFSVLKLILLMGLFKKYVPNNYIFLGLLSFMVPDSAPIIIFVIRNRKAVDYEAYMRAKREEFFRRQQEYQRRYGNTYGTPYGTPYQNPYNQNPYANTQNSNQNKADDEPFAEFASDKKGAENSQNAGSHTNNDADDFFS